MSMSLKKSKGDGHSKVKENKKAKQPIAICKPWLDPWIFLSIKGLILCKIRNAKKKYKRYKRHFVFEEI